MTLVRDNGSDAPPIALSVRPVVFRGGIAESTAAFLAMPGPVVCSVEVDPENDIVESNENNNIRRIPVEIPTVLFRLDIEPIMIDTAQNANMLNGVLEIANVGPDALRFPYASVQFHLDGDPIRVLWHVEQEPASGAQEREEAPLPLVPVLPGDVRPLPFSLHADLLSGEHVLQADLDEFALHRKAFFHTGPPPPTDNLKPLADAASLAPVRVTPTATDPNIHILLENETWRTFSDIPVLAGVEVLPSPVMTEQLTDAAGAPIRLWDLEVVLHFRPGINLPADRVEELTRRLIDQWYVETAWPLSDVEEILENGLLPDPDAPHRVAVRLAADTRARSLLRVRLPIARFRDEAPPFYAPSPPLPVVVEFSAQLLPPPAPRDENTPAVHLVYRAAIPLFQVGRLPAVGFLAVSPDTVDLVTAMVDPDNLIPEIDEEDNSTEITGSHGTAVFRAEASIDWTAPDTAQRPQLQLTVHGTLVNDGETDLVLDFPTALQMDFAWGDRYRWSDGRIFIEAFTRVEIPAGEEHTWEISVPLRVLWRTVLPTGMRSKRTRELPPELVLTVELVGTDFHDKAPVRLPGGHTLLDENNDLLPDAWTDVFLELSGDEGQTSDDESVTTGDPDGDGWDNLLEFLHGTNPVDPDDLPDGRLFPLHLFPGWNLISLPVAPEDAEPDALFGDATLGDVWEWSTSQDAPNGKYLPAKHIVPHTAYWVFAPTTADLQVPGAPHQTARLQLHAGWTLSGAGGPLRISERTRTALAIWGWDAEHQRYTPVSDGLMREGVGYWISAPEAVDLNLTGQ